MTIIQSGDTYDLYDSGVRTHNSLPPKTYTVEYEERRGFFLAEHSPIEVLEKAYGVQEKKIEKVMRAFEAFSRSLGIILSGDKGIGKTMFAKKLCIKASEMGLPVILIDKSYPDLSRFIESIDQECVILFDEFEKIFQSSTYDEDEDYDCDGVCDDQKQLLSLFDGTAGGKKLFIITCNDLSKVNDCLLNRPGRFHYHFRFEYPSQNEIEEYMKDNLKAQYHSVISKVVTFAKRARLNYDCLRAISFELNNGLDLNEALEDLNVLYPEESEYDITLYFENKKKLFSKRYSINLYGDDNPESWISLYDEAGEEIADVKFNRTKLKYDALRDETVISADSLTLSFNDYDEDNKAINYYRRLKPSHMTFSRSKEKKQHFLI